MEGLADVVGSAKEQSPVASDSDPSQFRRHLRELPRRAIALTHLTLNTGDRRASPRDEVERTVIDRLLPLIDRGHGEVPSMPPWHLGVIFATGENGERQDGAAFFQIAPHDGRSKMPAVMAMSAWLPERSADAWAMISGAYVAQQGSLEKAGLWRPLPSEPTTPWLAAFLTVFALQATPADLLAFGDLERCVAWAMIEQ
jgi:hypothetical protein